LSHEVSQGHEGVTSLQHQGGPPKGFPKLPAHESSRELRLRSFYMWREEWNPRQKGNPSTTGITFARNHRTSSQDLFKPSSFHNMRSSLVKSNPIPKATPPSPPPRAEPAQSAFENERASELASSTGLTCAVAVASCHDRATRAAKLAAKRSSPQILHMCHACAHLLRAPTTSGSRSRRPSPIEYVFKTWARMG